MPTELPLARRDRIAARLAGGQPVVALELAREFAVSEDAIRRDLRALAAEGRCRRVYGGALPPQPSPMAERIGEARAQKAALARAALALIAPGELIFLDSGSTNLALAQLLPGDRDLTVATNSVDIAASLLRRDGLRLIVIGGAVDPLVGGCVDTAAAQAVARLNIDRCVLGACAVSASAGVSVFDAADAAFKRGVLEASRASVVLATNDKLGSRVAHRVAALREIDHLVVEHDADPRERRVLARAGATVLTAGEPA